MSIRLTYVVAFLAASLSGCASPPAGGSFEHVEAPRDGGIVQLFVEADQLSANETTKALWACQSGVEAAQEDADERLIKPDKIDSTLPFITVSFQKEENYPNTIATMRENAGFPMKLFIESMNGSGCYVDNYSPNWVFRYAWVGVNFDLPIEGQAQCIFYAIKHSLEELKKSG